MFKLYKVAVADAEILAKQQQSKKVKNADDDTASDKESSSDIEAEFEEIAVQFEVKAIVNALKEQEGYDEESWAHMKKLFDIHDDSKRSVFVKKVALWLCEYGYPGTLFRGVYS